MSFNAPTGTNITFDSGDIALQAGTLRVKIYTKTLSGFDTSYDLDVFDISGYEIDFDLSEVGDVTQFPINVPEFTLTVSDIVRSSSNTHRFIAILDRLLLDDVIVVEVVFNSGSGYFYTTKDQCEFDFRERKVQIKAQHPLKYGEVALGNTWDGTYLSAETEPFAIISEVDAIQVNNFIKKYLEILGDNTTTYINSGLYPLVSSPSNGDPTILMELSQVTTSFRNATGIMRKIASSEGAIVGNILDYGFYSSRNKKDSSVTINASDLLELGVKINHLNVSTFNLDITYDNGIYSISDSTTFNDFGTTTIDIDFSFAEFEFAEWDSTDSRWEQPTNKTNEWLNGTTGVGTNPARNVDVINSYKKALRTTNDIWITGTIKGVDTIRPDQYITFGSGVFELVDGKDYRFSYMKYDVVRNIIEFEAYEV